MTRKSDSQMIELYQQRIDGFIVQVLSKGFTREQWNQIDEGIDFRCESEYRVKPKSIEERANAYTADKDILNHRDGYSYVNSEIYKAYIAGARGSND